MEKASPYLLVEKGQQQGTEHLHPLLDAMEKHKKISLTYCKFESKEAETYTLVPLCLKEYRRRWYLVARDAFAGEIKHYALDRIAALQVLDPHLQDVSNFDKEKHFQPCFGVTIPPDATPQEVVLSLSVAKGEYVKTLPLHPSQEILIDDENELRIRLKVYLSYDFIIELLSMGEHLKVISPQTLIDEMKRIYRETLERY